MSQEDKLRAKFESMNRDSYNFKRSRRGNYVNPVIARDWKWFQLGVASQAPAVDALRAYEKAQEDLFGQCCSNPVFNAWGKQVDMTTFNEAHRLASIAQRDN